MVLISGIIDFVQSSKEPRRRPCSQDGDASTTRVIRPSIDFDDTVLSRGLNQGSDDIINAAVDFEDEYAADEAADYAETPPTRPKT